MAVYFFAFWLKFLLQSWDIKIVKTIVFKGVGLKKTILDYYGQHED
jgi:hypothetical protein